MADDYEIEATDADARSMAFLEATHVFDSVGLDFSDFHELHEDAAEQLADYFTMNAARFHDVIPAARELLDALDDAIDEDDVIPDSVLEAMDALREELGTDEPSAAEVDAMADAEPVSDEEFI